MRNITEPSTEFGIDHVNGVRHDNHIENLRLVDRSTNLHNMRRLRNGKTSQYKGVSWCAHHSLWASYFRPYVSKHVLLLRTSVEVEAGFAYDYAANAIDPLHFTVNNLLETPLIAEDRKQTIRAKVRHNLRHVLDA
jgi:hypothetical protein